MKMVQKCFVGLIFRFQTEGLETWTASIPQTTSISFLYIFFRLFAQPIAGHIQKRKYRNNCNGNLQTSVFHFCMLKEKSHNGWLSSWSNDLSSCNPPIARKTFGITFDGFPLNLVDGQHITRHSLFCSYLYLLALHLVPSPSETWYRGMSAGGSFRRV